MSSAATATRHRSHSVNHYACFTSKLCTVAALLSGDSRSKLQDGAGNGSGSARGTDTALELPLQDKDIQADACRHGLSGMKPLRLYCSNTATITVLHSQCNKTAMQCMRAPKSITGRAQLEHAITCASQLSSGALTASVEGGWELTLLRLPGVPRLSSTA